MQKLAVLVTAKYFIDWKHDAISLIGEITYLPWVLWSVLMCRSWLGIHRSAEIVVQLRTNGPLQ